MAYVRKTIRDRFKLIDGTGLDNTIPNTQKLKIEALKLAHEPLFRSSKQKFNALLKKYEPK